MAPAAGQSEAEDDPDEEADEHLHDEETANFYPRHEEFAYSCQRALVPDAGFVDVRAGNVHDLAIDCGVHRGLIEGVSSDRYAPAHRVRRDQLASFVARLLTSDPTFREPAVIPDAFPDDDGNVHEPAIDLLAAVSVIAPGPAFRPSDPATRAEVADMLVRGNDVRRGGSERLMVNTYLPVGPDRFRDDDGHPLERSLDKAANAGIIRGVAPEAVQPDAPVRRDQFASLLMRTFACETAGEYRCSHHPNRRPGYDGMTGLEGFELTVELADAGLLDRFIDLDVPAYTPGDGIEATVQACNGRSTPLVMEFPFADWFVVEAVNQYRADGDWFWFYDPDYPHSEAQAEREAGQMGWFTYPHLPRAIDAGPGVTNLYYLSGGVSGPDDTVTWAPGQCRSWDVPAWFQNSLRGGTSPDHQDLWHEVPPGDGVTRGTPGRYRFQVQWGGVEHRIGWEPVRAVSTPFDLLGLRASARTGKSTYAYGETVDIFVELCNDTGRSVSVGGTGKASQLHVRVEGRSARANRAMSSEVHGGYVPIPEGGMTWRPGQCRGWSPSWDQHLSSGTHVGEPTDGPMIEPDPDAIWWVGVDWDPDEPGYHQVSRSSPFRIQP